MTPKEYVLQYVPDAYFKIFTSNVGCVLSDSKERAYILMFYSTEEQAWEVAAQMIKAERLKANDGWISVNDELPSDEKKCRIRVNGTVEFLPAFYYLNSKQWYIIPNMDIITNVTHWKPFETNTLID